VSHKYGLRNAEASARTHDEGASVRCVKEEDEARGVEGRQNVVVSIGCCT